LGIENLSEEEKLFEKNPTIDVGIVLLEKNMFVVKNYKKALFYGESCLNLGIDKTPAGWLVNIWMAKGYKELGVAWVTPLTNWTYCDSVL
jgi:hypothetical protein